MADSAPTANIVAFLEGIGLAVREAEIGDRSFLPGLLTRDGGIVLDRRRLEHPGDLLHEAGHLAVLAPADRARFGSDDDQLDLPQLEVAAVAWSFAAVVHLSLRPEVVFHSGGYRGRGAALARTYAFGVYPGAPALEAAGLTLTGARARAAGVAPYPHMLRWVRV